MNEPDCLCGHPYDDHHRKLADDGEQCWGGRYPCPCKRYRPAMNHA